MHELRLTRAAARDLGLRPVLYGHAAEDLIGEDTFIEKFVELRRESTVGQEPTLNVKPTTYNVHWGNQRGVTWHDRGNNIVWLCAVTWHDYSEIERRAARGVLLPDAEDYADVEEATAAERERPFVEAALADAVDLRTRAESSPGDVHTQRLADEVDVSLLVEVLGEGLSPADYWLVIHHPRARRRPVGAIGAGIELSIDDAITILVFEEATDDELVSKTTAPDAFGEIRPGQDHVFWWQRP